MTFNGRLLAFVAALSSACGQILGAEGNAWRDVIKWTAHHDGTGSEGMGHGQFLRDALEELELMTCECADHAELNDVLHAHRPDLVVIGLSAGGEEGMEVLNTLAINEFTGKVLLLGARSSPVLSALQQLGEQLKLEMLPALSTPFGSETLQDRVAMLLPTKVPQPPVELTEALSAGWLELWYQPKVDTRAVTGQRMQFDQLKRRQFVTLICGAVAGLPLAARAQQPTRHIGMLIGYAENDPETQARLTAFRQGLERLGWIEGHTVRIDYRFAPARPPIRRNVSPRSWSPCAPTFWLEIRRPRPPRSCARHAQSRSYSWGFPIPWAAASSPASRGRVATPPVSPISSRP